MSSFSKPALYRATRPLIRTWWRLSRGMTLGARVVVEDAAGRVVLVRHTYVAGWHFPGGGVEHGERAVDAARREAEEEAGVVLDGAPRLFGVYANFSTFRGDHVVLFRARGAPAGRPLPAHEIAESAWFDPSTPPEGASPATLRRLAEIYGGAAVSPDW